jgi:hypothetical protein
MEEDHVSWNRSFVGLTILIASLIFLVSAPLIRREWERRQPGTGQRAPLPILRYCSPGGTRPCIEFFSLDPRGGMLIYLQSANLGSPEFNLKIRHAENEKLYVCRRTSWSSLQVTCTGEAMPVGQGLLLQVISKEDDTVLASGTLPIVGLGLATPHLATTPTAVPLFQHLPR